MELIKQRLVECQDVLVGETDDTLLRRAQGRAGAYKDMLDAADAARELLNKGR